MNTLKAVFATAVLALGWGVSSADGGGVIVHRSVEATYEDVLFELNEAPSRFGKELHGSRCHDAQSHREGCWCRPNYLQTR